MMLTNQRMSSFAREKSGHATDAKVNDIVLGPGIRQERLRTPRGASIAEARAASGTTTPSR